MTAVLPTLEEFGALLEPWRCPASMQAWKGLSGEEILADIATARVIPNRRERRALQRSASRG